MWSAIEADFQRFYQLDPLDLGWRRFRALLSNLPEDSAFRSRWRGLHPELVEKAGEEAEEDRRMALLKQPFGWKKILDEAMGRPARVRVRMDLDDYMAAEGMTIQTGPQPIRPDPTIKNERT